VRVLLVPNANNIAAVTAARELVTWLYGIGVEPIMTQSDAELTDLPALGTSSSEIGSPELAVALGGDGTILKAFHVLGEVEVPLLGIKFGRLGFLSGAPESSMREAIETALAGEVAIERRATLKAEVVIEGRTAGVYRALNEVVLTRGASPRVIVLDTSVNGRHVASVRADGIVVATSTGSTAYALSAGGPIVAPDFRGLVVVPVAPHTLNNRALLTGPSDTVEVVVSDSERSHASLLVDGESTPSRRFIESVQVRRGDHDVALVKLHGRDFYDTVAQEFFGG
jgi:NAD+ kinase